MEEFEEEKLDSSYGDDRFGFDVFMAEMHAALEA